MNRPNVLALFQRQHGVASFEQLLDAGVSRRTIQRARERGALTVVLPGIFALPGTELAFEVKCRAALLYLGPRASLAYFTAAAIYGFRDMGRRVIHVAVPATQHVGTLPDWIRVHRTAWLEGDVVTRPDGLRLTSPLRTLFDLASKVNQFRFERFAEDAWHLNLVTPDDASEYLLFTRRSGRSGVAVFQSWLEKTSARKRPSQSGLELDVIDAIRSVGLPEPERQYPVKLLSGEIVHLDVAWPAIQFGLEPGASWWHGGDLKNRADIARDNACGEVGWFVRRLDESLRADPPATARLVKQLYDARHATYRPAS